MDTGCQSLLSVHHGNTFTVLQPQLHYNNIGLLKCPEMSDSLTFESFHLSMDARTETKVLNQCNVLVSILSSQVL